MKKLLSLLSVLTISGSSVPTTIAASPYQKQENKLENIEIINKQISSHIENNNYSWWDIVSAIWEIGIRKSEEFKNFLLEKVEDIKNCLENLIFSNIYKNLSYEEPYPYASRDNSFRDNSFIVDFEELETLRDSKVKDIIFDYFNNNLYLLTRNNDLYKIKENGNLQLIKSGDINGFSLDKNIDKNIYIFTTEKLYKNNVYNIEEEISNLRFIYFSLDNEK